MTLPTTSSIAPSPKQVTFANFAASTNAIKTSIATSNAPASYSGGALNGAVGGNSIAPCGRKITVTTTTHAATYNIVNAITITGLDMNGDAQTDTLTLTQVNGNETITGTKYFSKVTQIDIPAQADALGTFVFGVAAGVACGGTRMIRTGGAGDLVVTNPDGVSVTIPSCLAGEHVETVATAVSSSTAATNVTLFF